MFKNVFELIQRMEQKLLGFGENLCAGTSAGRSPATTRGASARLPSARALLQESLASFCLINGARNNQSHIPVQRPLALCPCPPLSETASTLGARIITAFCIANLVRDKFGFLSQIPLDLLLA